MEQRLDATFARIKKFDSGNLELQSDFAKYLCVLVSGYIETAMGLIIQEHARQNGSLSLQRYVGARMNKFTNANPQKIIDLLGSFKDGWRHDIEEFLDRDRRAAINSIITNRHRIAHG